MTNANGKSGPDGDNPQAGVTLDSAGNAYGTSPSGGANGGSAGVVWEVTKSGAYKDLHDFGGTVTNANGKAGPDGTDPVCNVVFDGNGNMYGTTINGGANGLGVVWEITQSGVYLDLHDFGGSVTDAEGLPATDGFNPHAGVTIDGAGNLYGAAPSGGAYGSGIVWEFTTSATYKDLHDFGQTSLDGTEPRAGVAFDSFGDIVGTTVYGGAQNEGIVWEITKTGAFKHLHDFGGTITNGDGQIIPDGTIPASGVTIDAGNDIFGATPTGGANNGGIAWEITSAGTYIDLHDFGGTIPNANGQSGPDGEHPLSVLTIGPDENLYGSASIGGPNDQGNGNNGAGMVWEITNPGTKAQTYTDLFDVGGDVSHPGFALPGSVTFDVNGNLFAASTFGGANYSGTVWELGVLGVDTIVVSPTSVLGGQISTGTVTLNGVALTGGASVALLSSVASATVPSTVTVAAGASSATFTISTAPVGSPTPATITAEMAGTSQTAELTVTPAVLNGLSVSPTYVVGGISSIGTVTLNGPAPTGGTAIALSSNSSNAVPPVSVTVPAGMTSATFGIGTVQVSAATPASITADLAGTSFSASLTVNPLALVSVSLNPSSVTGGNASSATVLLNGPAGTAGVVVTLSSSTPSVATVPASVTIATGKTSGTVTIPTTVVTTQKSSTIGAIFASATQSATLTVVPSTLQSVSLNPSAVTGGSSSTGTVTLTGPAPAGGLVMKLKSSSNDASLPASVTVAAGKTSATFTVKTVVVASVANPTITATYGTTSETATLTVNPAVLQSISLDPATVVGLTPSKGTATLTGAAPTGGITVQLMSSNSEATVPASVTIAAGHTTATFTVKTVTMASQVSATVSGTQGTVTKTATLTINPPVLKSLTLSPASVVGGKSSTGTVTLGAAAPSGGITITLAGGSNSVTLPKTVVVPAGSTTAKFTISTTAVNAQTSATVSATLGTVTQSAKLTVTK